ncbi:MAG: hypothetical protein AVDCRST_MAG30-2975 [uncultured Solirubrobacteraceae bacterium]|uniref:Uncharacterized protein n=1 Tax=uncultured Solirubrobacteraceae bacterium TaxID=1162706 RepID=A0A6J4TCN2_9ACTN|nr:MAG: hypothetical protein AVDCRST_MAG30-2975 [uncultured Solirubrobacteraceae bacterium]
MKRTIILGVALLFTALLGFLTLYVIFVNREINVLEIISLLVLGLFGFGILGALASPPDDR